MALPPREDFIHYIDFSQSESALYEAAKKQSVELLNDTLLNGAKTTFSALQSLNQLRLICNHGVLANQLARDDMVVSVREDDIKSPVCESPGKAESTTSLDSQNICPLCGSQKTPCFYPQQLS